MYVTLDSDEIGQAISEFIKKKGLACESDDITFDVTSDDTGELVSYRNIEASVNVE